MIDPIAISAIIISILGAITMLIKKTHLKHINICCCIESECNNINTPDIISTPIQSPISTPIISKKFSEV